jgi:hypothetical protein
MTSNIKESVNIPTVEMLKRLLEKYHTAFDNLKQSFHF